MRHHGRDSHRRQFMGGVMRLGKALATGVAEERPQEQARERAPEQATEVRAAEEVREPAASVPEEVPAVR
ncbi:hypothetical protein GCM10010129_29030 [Streptomyces fumigatiscleroticus]|nr:hypothetical protein GCM10010129_29030 [Streptomyces fumigatiscleroticus]